jgi:Na+/proline symporter
LLIVSLLKPVRGYNQICKHLSRHSMAIPMEDITADHQFLRDRIVESEVQGPLKILQLITATMLLGSLSLGLVMSFLFLDQPAEPAPKKNDPIQASIEKEAVFPVLGICSMVLAIGGILFGTTMLQICCKKNQALLASQSAGNLFPSMIQSAFTAWLMAAATLEGPLLMAILFAVLSSGMDRTICLVVATAILAWWLLHLPTQSRFAKTLGLD